MVGGEIIEKGRRPSGEFHRVEAPLGCGNGEVRVSGPREILYTVYKCPGARRRRVLPLPAPVQTDKARARFQDGVLEVRIPKTEEARKKSRKVAIE